MPLLFGREISSSNTRLARGVSGGISVAAQLTLGIVVVAISAGAPQTTAVKSPLSRPRFVSAVFLSEPIVALPIELVTDRKAPDLKAPDEVKLPEPAPDRSALVAVRTFENKAVPTPSVAEVRPVDVAPRPAPPAPAPPPPPAPSVGAFPNIATTARATEPAKRVEAAGFDTPAVHAAQSQLGPVIESGFTQASPGAQPTQQSRVIRDSGFGASDNRERPKAQDRQAVQAGFVDAREVEPIRRAASVPTTPKVVPVEVLSKPTPIYTDEARRLKVEGEVVLEVEFCASGAVRVVRVVRGLGHGLDESATLAAQRIQFKPATSEGRAVDYRATVQIVFRLA